jgi:hypothetical protein
MALGYTPGYYEELVQLNFYLQGHVPVLRCAASTSISHTYMWHGLITLLLGSCHNATQAKPHLQRTQYLKALKQQVIYQTFILRKETTNFPQPSSG